MSRGHAVEQRGHLTKQSARHFAAPVTHIVRIVISIPSRAVLIPLISDSGIGIAILTKEPEPEPTPEWNRLRVWNWLHPKVNLTIEHALTIKAV